MRVPLIMRLYDGQSLMNLRREGGREGREGLLIPTCKANLTL